MAFIVETFLKMDSQIIIGLNIFSVSILCKSDLVSLYKQLERLLIIYDCVRFV